MELLYTATTTMKLIATDGEEAGEVESYYYLVRCKTCSDISLFWNWDLAPNPNELKDENLVFPVVKRFSDGVPEAIRRSYTEAKKVQKISPSAFAAMIRRALEYVCRDQNAKGRNLRDQIFDLAKKGVIPSTLTKMALMIKTLGNIGAHASDVEIQPDHAETELMDDFFAAVIEYVYIAPEKIVKLLQQRHSR